MGIVSKFSTCIIALSFAWILAGDQLVCAQESPESHIINTEYSINQSKVGISLLVKGKVKAISLDGQERKLKATSPIFEGDRIETGKNGFYQASFLDGSMMRIDKESDFTIDEYYYDEEDSDAKSDISVDNGTLAFLAGKISKIAPQNYKIETATATVGIRGSAGQLVVSDGSRGGEPFMKARVAEGHAIDIATDFGTFVLDDPAVGLEVTPAGVEFIDVSTESWVDESAAEEEEESEEESEEEEEAAEEEESEEEEEAAEEEESGEEEETAEEEESGEEEETAEEEESGEEEETVEEEESGEEEETAEEEESGEEEEAAEEEATEDEPEEETVEEESEEESTVEEEASEEEAEEETASQEEKEDELPEEEEQPEETEEAAETEEAVEESEAEESALSEEEVEQEESVEAEEKEVVEEETEAAVEDETAVEEEPQAVEEEAAVEEAEEAQVAEEETASVEEPSDTEVEEEPKAVEEERSPEKKEEAIAVAEEEAPVEVEDETPPPTTSEEPSPVSQEEVPEATPEAVVEVEEPEEESMVQRVSSWWYEEEEEKVEVEAEATVEVAAIEEAPLVEVEAEVEQPVVSGVSLSLETNLEVETPGVELELDVPAVEVEVPVVEVELPEVEVEIPVIDVGDLVDRESIIEKVVSDEIDKDLENSLVPPAVILIPEIETLIAEKKISGADVQGSEATEKLAELLHDQHFEENQLDDELLKSAFDVVLGEALVEVRNELSTVPEVGTVSTEVKKLISAKLVNHLLLGTSASTSEIAPQIQSSLFSGRTPSAHLLAVFEENIGLAGTEIKKEIDALPLASLVNTEIQHLVTDKKITTASVNTAAVSSSTKSTIQDTVFKGSAIESHLDVVFQETLDEALTQIKKELDTLPKVSDVVSKISGLVTSKQLEASVLESSGAQETIANIITGDFFTSTQLQDVVTFAFGEQIVEAVGGIKFVPSTAAQSVSSLDPNSVVTTIGIDVKSASWSLPSVWNTDAAAYQAVSGVEWGFDSSKVVDEANGLKIGDFYVTGPATSVTSGSTIKDQLSVFNTYSYYSGMSYQTLKRDANSAEEISMGLSTLAFDTGEGKRLHGVIFYPEQGVVVAIDGADSQVTTTGTSTDMVMHSIYGGNVSQVEDGLFYSEMGPDMVNLKYSGDGADQVFYGYERSLDSGNKTVSSIGVGKKVDATDTDSDQTRLELEGRTVGVVLDGTNDSLISESNTSGAYVLRGENSFTLKFNLLTDPLFGGVQVDEVKTAEDYEIFISKDGFITDLALGVDSDDNVVSNHLSITAIDENNSFLAGVPGLSDLQYVGWGIWSLKESTGSQRRIFGYTAYGINNLQTTSSDISSLIGDRTSNLVTYKGAAMGSIFNVGTANPGVQFGKTTMNVDFGTGAVDGTINFANDAINLSRSSGTDIQSMFTGSAQLNGQGTGYFRTQFFGSMAAEAAGTFSAESGTKRAIGAFGVKKD